jgi:hypothetical protein
VVSPWPNWPGTCLQSVRPGATSDDDEEIANLISPVREVSPEELRIIIDSLEADGGLTIEGGAVRATPFAPSGSMTGHSNL